MGEGEYESVEKYVFSVFFGLGVFQIDEKRSHFDFQGQSAAIFSLSYHTTGSCVSQIGLQTDKCEWGFWVCKLTVTGGLFRRQLHGGKIFWGFIL